MKYYFIKNSKFTLTIKLLFINAFIIGIFQYSYANPEIDSLLTELKKATHDTTRMRINNEISNYFTKRNPDTAYYFVNQALKISENYKTTEKDKVSQATKKYKSISFTYLGNYYKALGKYDEAIKNYKKSLNLKRELNDLKGEAYNFIDIGSIKVLKSSYYSAVDYYENAVKIFQQINNDKGLAKVHRNIGNVYYYQGEWDLALDSYQKSLELSVKINDESSMSSCYNNIGIIHTLTERYNWAIEYFKKSLVLKKKLNDQRGEATIYNGMGQVYYEKEEYDEALNYFKKSLEIRKKVKHNRGTAISLMNIGKVLVEKENFLQADSNYKASLQIFKDIEDQEFTSDIYNAIASINYKQKRYSETINYAEKSLSIAKEISALPRLRDSYKILSEAYEQQYNINKAFHYFKLYFDNYKLYIAVKDSIYNKESNDMIEREQRYRMAQKQKELEAQKLATTLKEREAEALENERTFLFIGLAAMLIFVFIMYRNYKQKTKANKLLKQQKEEIEKAKEEIEAQRDLVIEKNEIVMAQKTEIEDSIIYAKNIQQAVLPSSEFREQILPEHFLFFRPKDIVSGDFFWMKKLKNFVVVAIADCTGHGVPGAFMSMLGLMFLNETVTTRSLDNTGQILNKLREKIKQSLHQSGKEGEAKDGMDMSFFIIDMESKELQFSGAFNPLYIIRENSNIEEGETFDSDGLKVFNSKDPSVDATLIEIKGDRQPIAIYMYEKDFSTHVFQLKEGDRLYSFSDGYPDQFGGDLGKKFNAKRFKELLLNIRNHPMEEQKLKIKDNFYEWMGDIDQVDDVVLMGLKV